MAEFIPKIIDVNLVYGTVSIDTASFDVPLIIASHGATTNRADVYTSYQAVIDGGHAVGSPVAIMAQLAFSGVASPSRVIIGRRALDSFTVTVGNSPAVGDVVTLEMSTGVSDKTFKYTVVTDDTDADILDGIAALVEADAVYGPLVAFGTAAGSAVTVTISANQVVDLGNGLNTTITRTTTETIANALTAIEAENDEYFWMLADSHVEADVLALAAYAESSDKLYAFSTQLADVKNGTEGHLVQDLSELGYQHTWCVMYKDDADTTFPEAGGIAAIAGSYPGTTTMQGKTLKGVAVNKLTTTEITNIVEYNGNVYLREYGVNFYRDGRMVNGDFVDLIHFALWMKARVGESLFGLMKRRSDSLDKISFDASGMAKIKQTIWNNPIQIAINRNAIMNEIVQDTNGLNIDLRPVIQTPLRADIPENDIANRILKDVSVEVVYKTPIHYVKINVGVILNRTQVN